MCKVTHETNGEGQSVDRVRFGTREWVGLAGLMLSIALAVSAAMGLYVRLYVAGHAGQADIHQSSLTKDGQFVTESEFQRWAEGHNQALRTWIEAHEKHPHNGVTDDLADHEARLRLLEQR
jgi:hypothetical protein